jgi:hypothetical protein
MAGPRPKQIVQEHICPFSYCVIEQTLPAEQSESQSVVGHAAEAIIGIHANDNATANTFSFRFII